MARLLGVSKAEWRVRLNRLRPVWPGISRQVHPLPFRGQPVTRPYIDRFFETHCSDIQGDAVEVREPMYSDRYPDQLANVDILDIDAALPGVTIVADLQSMPNVPSDTFDVAIVPQTLQYVFDVQLAINELHRVLAPGGVLLMTVPAAERMRSLEGFEHDYWRFTTRSVRRLLSPFADVDIVSFGNCLAAIAHYRRVPAAKLRDRFWIQDPLYPVIIGARAIKQI